MANWLKLNVFGPVGDAIDGWAWLSGEASELVVNGACSTTRNRPHPWSTFSDYVSWDGLTNRTWLARHLPPADLPVQPDPVRIQALFARPEGRQRLSTKSTCLFPAFAQYLTDGFIRTVPTDPRRTTTNHEIDLCPLYGRTRQQTLVLRLRDETAGRRGRLKSRMIGAEEFPPFLFREDGTTIEPEFAALDKPLLVPGQSEPPQLPWPPPGWNTRTLFAIGGDRANATPYTSMMNTLLLREHNRLAAELDRRNPRWDDERVFQTARNILIVMFIKIVVEHYINHITPLPFSLRTEPAVAWKAPWNRTNWITAEFSLLYRWHSLMPDAIDWPGRAPIPLAQFSLDNQPLLDVGLDAAFSAASAQKAGELGAFNTSPSLVPIEIFAVRHARANRLASYNAYRVAFEMEPARSFDEISSNPDIAGLLEDLYGHPDHVEFYPGLFAEDRVADGVLPGLLMRMVALDAFSQALTNPLMSEHVWKEPTTFTPWGMQEIEATSKLGDLLARNVPHRGATPIEMTQPGWEYGRE
jgi:prostaglandin-endoperoxide synthase 2